MPNTALGDGGTIMNKSNMVPDLLSNCGHLDIEFGGEEKWYKSLLIPKGSIPLLTLILPQIEKLPLCAQE